MLSKGQIRLRHWLADTGTTQRAFAATVGRSQSNVCRWTMGQATPDLSSRRAIEREAGIPAAEWFEELTPQQYSVEQATWEWSR